MKNLAAVILFSLLLLAEVTVLAQWETVSANGEPVARHEAAFSEFEGKYYLLGGRRLNPVSVYDPATNRWENRSRPPLEVHHFQPVNFGDAIYLMGAMTGPFPNEEGLDRVLVYYPREDRWESTHPIPESRRRGGAGAVLYGNKIYLVGGIVRGHQGGFVPWFDEYDPATGEWRELPDAPHARDHFQAGVVGTRLYAAGGRQTSRETRELFSRTVPAVDVFDFATGQWSTLPKPLPTPRAGTSTVAVADDLIVLGGESGAQREAHREVEAYSESTEAWRSLPPLNRGRHGTGAFLHNGFICTCSGSGNRGGGPELTSMERLPLEFVRLGQVAPVHPQRLEIAPLDQTLASQ